MVLTKLNVASQRIFHRPDVILNLIQDPIQKIISSKLVLSKFIFSIKTVFHAPCQYIKTWILKQVQDDIIGKRISFLISKLLFLNFKMKRGIS